jgi:hypothetical protein
MSVPALKVYPLPDALPASPLARIGGARNPRGLATIRQVRREQARIYLAAKRGEIAPEQLTRFTYALRELIRTLELESGPLDARDAPNHAPQQPSTELPRLRALLAQITGRAVDPREATLPQVSADQGVDDAAVTRDATVPGA